MIRVDFLYRLKTQDLPLMLEKFKASGDKKFSSSPSNIKMEMGFREFEDQTDISLNIYYKSRRDYEKRTQFERLLLVLLCGHWVLYLIIFLKACYSTIPFHLE